ncbi:recombinase family protein [Nonomuraea sp. LP-02]|uniref:recombinase family protein n=1 Tax=Nonomuraea sp. LP-02 TaxID=3097960 RepID=UPI002E30A0BA|nr:recombinase family protein [Nonomuraea sp. LP-02]MED7931307.1 recombinase family protein [Nonomuraea sp. LP-02]
MRNAEGHDAVNASAAAIRVGYARCSTDEQDVVVQTEQLLGLGVPADRIYIDRGLSGTTRRNRGGLDQALAAVWPASVFTVTKFDRFTRNMAEANQILTDLSDRGVLFGLGGPIYDRNDPFGRLFLQILAMVAEFEANFGHLRTREGMALAKKNGKLKGKQPKLPEPARRSIRRRYAEGKVSLADLATEYSVGRSLFRPLPTVILAVACIMTSILRQPSPNGSRLLALPRTPFRDLPSPRNFLDGSRSHSSLRRPW